MNSLKVSWQTSWRVTPKHGSLYLLRARAFFYIVIVPLSTPRNWTLLYPFWCLYPFYFVDHTLHLVITSTTSMRLELPTVSHQKTYNGSLCHFSDIKLILPDFLILKVAFLFSNWKVICGIIPYEPLSIWLPSNSVLLASFHDPCLSIIEFVVVKWWLSSCLILSLFVSWNSS